ncbi:MAG: formylmethanofuran dehydrogenase [Desulfomonile tiedjei]|uniref:Formylmethanofuran dehydrogenase n=1 Tax=Desulfomonile tiedjei TaxID=2358 RepID=A0A9D6Z2B8_9BACT|nr:formylmethanofuran dehydrogenase [Desulfomonile tiedjei]
MSSIGSLPEDFQKCVEFHRHLCPGLAIGYAVAKAALKALDLQASSDEEIVAVVENDSCAVDAIQALVGCTFGKGNLVFRDWGKQVFTFFDRSSGRGVRVSFVGPVPGHEERKRLREKVDSGVATEDDKLRLLELRDEAVAKLVSADSRDLFSVTEMRTELPPSTVPVTTRPCPVCGEYTVVSRMVDKNGDLLCADCAQ